MEETRLKANNDASSNANSIDIIEPTGINTSQAPDIASTPSRGGGCEGNPGGGGAPLAPKEVPPTPSKKGLRRSAGVLQGKLEARIVQGQETSQEAHTTSTGKGFQRGLRRSAEERQAKLDARMDQAKEVHTRGGKGEKMRYSVANLPTLRGLAKNRKQAPNANLTKNVGHGGGLRKNSPPQRTNCLGNFLHFEECPDPEYDLEEAVEALPVASSTTPGLPSPEMPMTPNGPSLPTTSSDTGLAVAHPVQDDLASNIEALEVDPEELLRKERRKQNGRECRIIACVISSLSFIVLMLTLALTLGKKEEGHLPPSGAPTLAPSESPPFCSY